MSDVGKKIIVIFPGYKRDRIIRTLAEDKDGLFVRYQNQRVSVRPYETGSRETLPGYYLGIHPKLARQLGR